MASACEVKKETLRGAGRRAGQLGRQKIPVVRTAKTKRPSKAASRVATARHQRRGAMERAGLVLRSGAMTRLLIMTPHYAGRRSGAIRNLRAKRAVGARGFGDSGARLLKRKTPAGSRRY